MHKQDQPFPNQSKQLSIYDFQIINKFIIWCYNDINAIKAKDGKRDWQAIPRRQFAQPGKIQHERLSHHF